MYSVNVIRLFSDINVSQGSVATRSLFYLHWGPGHPPPAERGPSLESIYRVSLKVDHCECNKIISLKEFISPQRVGAPRKEKKSGALGTCPV